MMAPKPQQIQSRNARLNTSTLRRLNTMASPWMASAAYRWSDARGSRNDALPVDRPAWAGGWSRRERGQATALWHHQKSAYALRNPRIFAGPPTCPEWEVHR